MGGTNMITALDSIRNSLAQAVMALPEDVQSPIVAQIDPNDFPLNAHRCRSAGGALAFGTI